MAELPQNWIEIKLKHLIKFVIGGDWGTEKPTISNSERVAVIRGTEYKYWKKIRAKEAAIRYVKKSSLEKRQLNIGDIVLEISGGGPTQPVARTIVIDKHAIESNKCNLICSNFFRKISLKPSIYPAYLNFYCQYAHKIGLFNAFQTQTTNLRNLNFNDFINNVFIPIPPENEQFKIINKLDKIISKIDGVNTRLDKIPIALKRARQSILNQAITGELTKDWREKNNIKYTWKETSLKSIVLTYKNGLSKRSGKEGKATVVLRLADLCNHKIIKDNIREIKITDNEAKQYKLDYNDILIIRVNGSEDIVGRFILYDLNENWIYCDHLIRLKYDKTIIEPYYLFYYAQTNVVREYIKANVVSSAGQNTINQKTLDNMPLLLPPIEEQAEIVRRVKLAFEKLDKIESKYQKVKEYSDKLTQPILNKAFRGELVPQDPNDSPIKIPE